MTRIPTSISSPQCGERGERGLYIPNFAIAHNCNNNDNIQFDSIQFIPKEFNWAMGGG